MLNRLLILVFVWARWLGALAGRARIRACAGNRPVRFVTHSVRHPKLEYLVEPNVTVLSNVL